jgi:hypothetical protein
MGVVALVVSSRPASAARSSGEESSGLINDLHVWVRSFRVKLSRMAPSCANLASQFQPPFSSKFSESISEHFAREVPAEIAPWEHAATARDGELRSAFTSPGVTVAATDIHFKDSLFVSGICNQLLQAIQIDDAWQELSADDNARCTSEVQGMCFRIVTRK